MSIIREIKTVNNFFFHNFNCSKNVYLKQNGKLKITSTFKNKMAPFLSLVIIN